MNEEDKLFLEKAEENFTKGKNHEEYEEIGIEDEMNDKYLNNSLKRKKLKINNETAGTEENISFVEKGKESVTKEKNDEESEDNGKSHMNDENDREEHYKDENIDRTLRNTDI